MPPDLRPNHAIKPPTGTVVLVFTDIQGSSALWEALHDDVRAGLALHDELMRVTMAAHGGYEMRTEGDSFKVAFGDALAAVRWCLDVQDRLLALPWPAGLADHPHAASVDDAGGRPLFRGLRVRMGAHIGAPEAVEHPVTGRMDYFGPMVNLTARIANTPSGGQIALSAALADVVRPALARDDVVITDLGEYQLKGVSDPQRICSTASAALSARPFGPLNATPIHRTNLRRRTDAFVGRAGLVEAVGAAFDEGERLITLVGPGGVGKTRLITELGHARAESLAGGLWFCDLSEATDASGVVAAVAKAVGLPLGIGATIDEAASAVGRALAGLGDVYVLLDNFEQVVSVAQQTVGAWLEATQSARFLVTSREALQLPGERRWPLSPLTAEQGAKLFVTRAQAVHPQWTPTPADDVAIAAIVEQLDGMPLAIELAASRVEVMAPKQIEKRLSQRFRLLSDGSRATDRQATLRGAIDWSWELLDEAERSTLAQCSIFRGGFTVDAADNVVDLDSIDGAPWPLDVVQALARKSLLFSDDHGAEMRLGMYRSIHAYAQEKLGELGQVDAAAQRHATFFSARAALWAKASDGPSDLDVLPEILADAENLIAAHESTSDALAKVDIARSLEATLNTAGPATVFLDLVNGAVKSAEAADEPALSARALIIRGAALRLGGRRAEATDDFARALDHAVAAGDEGRRAQALMNLSMTSYRPREEEEVVDPRMREAVEIARAAGRHDIEALALAHASIQYVEALRAEEAKPGFLRALELLDAHGSRIDLAWLQRLWGAIQFISGDAQGAVDSLLAVVEIYERIGARTNLGGTYSGLSVGYAELDDPEQSLAYLKLSRRLLAPSGAIGLIATSRLGDGFLALALGRLRPEEAETQRAVAEGLVEEMTAAAPDGGPSLAERSKGLDTMTAVLRKAIARDRAASAGPDVEA